MSLNKWILFFKSYNDSISYKLSKDDVETLLGFLEELKGAREAEGTSCDDEYPIPIRGE